MAQSTDEIDAPADREKATAAAYLRMIGHTQHEAASGAGVGRRTLARWEKCSWWAGVCEEAADRWLNDLKQEARVTLLKVVRSDDESVGDGLRALQVLERTDHRLAPPAHQIQHSGPDGEAVNVTTIQHHYHGNGGPPDADSDAGDG